VQLRQLQRQADAARSVLDDFLRRSQETQHMEGLQISQVRVLSEAVPPVRPTWPRPKLLLAVSVALGLMLGCALALVMGPRARSGAGRSGTGIVSRFRLTRKSPVGPVGEGRRDLPVLGAVALPYAGGGLPAGIHALRVEMQRFRNTALLRSVEQLLVAITDRLRPGARPPFVVLVSSLRAGGERHMAAAAIGIGLDHIHQKVLVVDLVAAAMQQPSPILAGLRTAPFLDPSSGLRTMIVDASSSMVRSAGEAAGMIDHWMAIAATPADFVIVIDRPFADTGRSAGLAARADLTVFALGPADRVSGNEWLGDRLAPEERGRSATMLVEMASGGPAATGARQPPSAANIDHPRDAVPARG
jgi:hypothetical protein